MNDNHNSQFDQDQPDNSPLTPGEWAVKILLIFSTIFFWLTVIHLLLVMGAEVKEIKISVKQSAPTTVETDCETDQECFDFCLSEGNAAEFCEASLSSGEENPEQR